MSTDQQTIEQWPLSVDSDPIECARCHNNIGSEVEVNPFTIDNLFTAVVRHSMECPGPTDRWWWGGGLT
jgi:hypothetical protein